MSFLLCVSQGVGNLIFFLFLAAQKALAGLIMDYFFPFYFFYQFVLFCFVLVSVLTKNKIKNKIKKFDSSQTKARFFLKSSSFPLFLCTFSIQNTSLLSTHLETNF